MLFLILTNAQFVVSNNILISLLSFIYPLKCIKIRFSIIKFNMEQMLHGIYCQIDIFVYLFKDLESKT